MEKREEKVMEKIGKPQKKIINGDKKKRVKRNESYKIYIRRVLRYIYPDIGISNEAVSILNSICIDIFERIANAASKLVTYSKPKRRTITEYDIQTAVVILLSGELSKHAVSEGVKATNKFFLEA